MANDEELRLLADMIQPCIVEVSMNVHGTRAVQTMIEVLSKNTKRTEHLLLQIISYLRPSIKELSLVSPITIFNLSLERPW